MEDPRVKQEVKQEMGEHPLVFPENRDVDFSRAVPLNELSDSSISGDGNATVCGGRKRDTVSSGLDGVLPKKKKLDGLGSGLVGPPPLAEPPALTSGAAVDQPLSAADSRSIVDRGCKLFWKAGEYEGASGGGFDPNSGGLDHVRVHPKFLHSNATSHKWALGAFAELLDNSMDEICNGATYVNVDILQNNKDGSKMLLIEDNGGGMKPETMRQCMSLGYSVKSKMANTIGQYGNGFKTSTMRLGADVIVFSRCCGKDGKSPTQTIGLLSYTFLRSTGKEDIVVPMIDYEKRGQEWNKMIRYAGDWNKNVETIVQWSPFLSESDLLRQFNFLEEHGTRIIIYNLWEDDSGQLELDFDTDQEDIQIRGVNREDKNIQMAKQFPNSRHFLTYRHSLRSYASILYLRIPPGFRIFLRGKDIEHHNLVNDMMMTQEVTYRPQAGAEGVPKDSNMVAVVTVGFVKDARHHIDVQGFNVYHKNRLIKPFWRLWNAAGSDGRGVIGVLEANFVEPAHDKQGFERTIVLSRLETRLQQMQKTYWTTYCHKIGYAPRRKKSISESPTDNPDDLPKTYSQHKTKVGASTNKTPNDLPKTFSQPKAKVGASSSKAPPQASQSNQKERGGEFERTLKIIDLENTANMSFGHRKYQSSSDYELTERVEGNESGKVISLQHDLEKEREKRKLLETELQEAKQTIEEMTKEQDTLIDIFSEERERRTIEEENLRNKLKDASNTIQELLKKVAQGESIVKASSSPFKTTGGVPGY